ncbi:GH92 family glycosyl hydrolase [bacterium]|nr:GH92 family glycosyl hydrolase [bacterium]
MHRSPIPIVLLLALIAPVMSMAQQPVDFVDPFIGTDDMGHMYPGASAPFGMVQLSPETDTLLYSYGQGYNPGVYRYCSGYQYADSTIVGFSHTHFNGTGHSDLGDFLLMPTVGPLLMNPGTGDRPESGYRSRFSHDREDASPGYYRVMLDDYSILAELTATERTGFHRYTFPASDAAHLILDLTSGIYNYDGKVIWASLRVENDTLVTGFRQTRGWARTRYLYFAMTLSKPIASYELLNDERPVYGGFWRKFDQSDNFPQREGKKVRAHFDFSTAVGETIKVKVALSAVSTANALENLRSEIPGWDFDAVHGRVRSHWNRELSRVMVQAEPATKTNFYTALYHTFLSPVVYSDVNGEYRGLDQNIHRADGFTNYTIFSLWDTYRALHPLFTILQQRRTGDMIRSMLAHYEESVHHILPVWSHYSNENWCMIGYHAVPVIADALLKGIGGYDTGKAFTAMKASADYDIYDGIGYYKQYGYVPEDLNSNSASKTLEYAYDDFTIAQAAKRLGRTDDYKRFIRRAANYRNIFDPETGFLRARLSDGSFKDGFDPMNTHGQGYIEGNAWNYSLYVPHDIAGFMELIGGAGKLVEWLDGLFVMDVADASIAGNEDITRAGMIGNYVHGNEPSHHVPYMYNYAGMPWKTQERVHQIMTGMYKARPDGLCGNDDCGQMSAWYVFSALGFYPVCPGDGVYVIGSPCVERAEIALENGRRFIMKAEYLSGDRIYIQSVTLNGRPLNRSWISHEEVIGGGRLVCIMGDTPNRDWAAEPEEVPPSMSRDPKD